MNRLAYQNMNGDCWLVLLVDTVGISVCLSNQLFTHLYTGKLVLLQK
uniref:Uncharacterized protein n=1 Tax=Anguilla anguilla TaxID=7936 RepID=A0A0E9TH79_ANGAN